MNSSPSCSHWGKGLGGSCLVGCMLVIGMDSLGHLDGSDGGTREAKGFLQVPKLIVVRVDPLCLLAP